MPDHQQIILFGSPGTGKSHRIREQLVPALDIDPRSEDCVQTVFHPEYTYGDFMGKLMPLTQAGKVEYQFYTGYFMRALARAYRNLLVAGDDEPQHVALVIDEINRGNSSAIFGTAFQLLDRGPDGWSAYTVDLSTMEFDQLLRETGFEIDPSYSQKGILQYTDYTFESERQRNKDGLNKMLEPLGIRRDQIRLPPNLSVFATMNTSDNSIYYMDAAFKRRWDWLFVDTSGESPEVPGVAFQTRAEWEAWANSLNDFIRDNHSYVRRVEDKQVGHWFLAGDRVTNAQVQNKVLFFLWDSVFTTSRKPLAETLGMDEADLVTFGAFASRTTEFIEAISAR